MKFLCDQCKAKYQIADEKVAGKTVRMKCRKCGHMIEVKAEVTETSVATKLPGGPALAPPVRAGAPPAKPTAPRAQAPRAPAAPVAKPAAPKSTLATSLASARPPAQSRAEGPLASAFQKSVQQRDDDAAMLDLHTASEWYVAINGVPVGPIRVGELKRKAAGGGITEDSLCWQEGMEEWRPVRTVTELAALLREVVAAGRPSLVTPPVADNRPSASPPGVSPKPAQTPRAPQPSRVDSNRPLAPAARSNVVAINSRLATAEQLHREDEEEDRTVVGDPFAMPPPPARPVADPFAAPIVATAPIAAAAPVSIAATSDFTAPVAQPTKQPPWIAIGMLVLFAAFGVTAAVMIFQRPPAVAPVATVAPVTSVAPTTPTTSVAIADTAPVASAAPTTSEKPQAVAVNNNGVRPTSTGTGKVIDPSIAALLGNNTGPVGPGTGPTGGGGGGGGSALSSDAIESVVRMHSAGVKRQCWERGGSTTADVSVKVHLTIAGNGTVKDTSASGNDPAIAKCIENSVRMWTFPASGGNTDVDIPFHFLRQ